MMRVIPALGFLFVLFSWVACGSSDEGSGDKPKTDAGTGGGSADATPDVEQLCTPGTAFDCYEGEPETTNKGACQSGVQLCLPDGLDYGECENQVLPEEETCTTPVDDDCDGLVNEAGGDCTCQPGEAAPCYSAAASTIGVGSCKEGTQVCKPDGTGFGTCLGEVVPGVETCENTIDDDCDGELNEEGTGCICVPGTEESCYSGPGNTEGVGACAAGTRTCNVLGTAWLACVGEVLPGTESCTTLVDDDCDGSVNEAPECACTPGADAPCYSAASGTLDVGICKAGTQVCQSGGQGFGPCFNEITPGTETCNTPVDDDCDGEVNEEGSGCVCLPSSTDSCYTGPPATSGVGICEPGTRVCNAQGTAYGPCEGETHPATETCNTPEDDDCDGEANESGTGCVCAPDSTQPCYSGPANTAGVGLCKAGTETCNALGTAYGPCLGEILPSQELCATPEDDDCDGEVNEEGPDC